MFLLCKCQVLPNSRSFRGGFLRDPNKGCGLSGDSYHPPCFFFCRLPWSQFCWISMDFFVSKRLRILMDGFPQRPKCQTSAWDLALALWLPVTVASTGSIKVPSGWGEVLAFRFGERFFWKNGWFSKAKIFQTKKTPMESEFHWNLAWHEGVIRYSSNHIKWASYS